MGYAQAGYEVIGVDIRPQPKYPFRFIEGDALEVLQNERLLEVISAIHASPPCQAYTRARKLQGNEHPELIAPTREALKRIGKPYVIENVPGAPLENPVLLCGTMFGLPLYRHRLFETNFPIVQPLHPQHQWDNVKMGRKPKEGEFIQPVGHFSDVPAAQKAMEIDWLGQDELREAIPPAMTLWIGLQMRAYTNLKASESAA